MARNPAVLVSLLSDWDGKDLAKAQREIAKLQAQTKTFSDKFAAMGQRMQDFGKNVSKVGGSLTKSVTLPLVGIGAAATAMAVEFDTSLTKMVSLVGLTREEVDGMRTDIIRMASQYGKSADEAADAMFFITSAGLRGADAMETLEASLKGAAIGLGDVQTIADLATSAMNAYGADTLSATQATSVLRTAVEQGKLESSALAGAMGEVLPIASALGVGFDEAAAAMASMSRTGTNAAGASTQLSAIMSALVKETPKGAKALKDVGLSYEGIRQQIREKGLLSTLQTLVSAFGDDTIATAELFGNKRALVGVMDLLGSGAATTAEIFGALAATTADDLNPAFEAASETTGFKLQQAFATLKNSLIEFGDIIAPAVEAFAAKLTDLGNAFKNLDPQTKQFIVIAGAIAAAVGPILLVVGKFITLAGVLTKAVAGITLAGSLLAIKVIAIVAAVAAVVVAFKLMWDRSEALRKAVGTLISTVKNIAQTLLRDVVDAFRSVTGEAGDLRSIFDRVATVAGNVLAGAIQVLTRYWNILANGVRVVIKVYEVVFKIIGMVANIIRGALIVAFDVLMNKLGPISTALQNVATGVKAAFSTIASVVSAAFRNVMPAIENVINFAIRGINAMIDAYNKLADVLPGVSRATHIAEFQFQDMTASVERASYSANNLANDVGGYAGQVLRGNQVVEAGTSTLDAFADTAVEAASDIGSVGDAAGGAADKVENDLTRMRDKAAALVQDMRKKLKKELDDAREDFFSFARTVSSAISSALDFGSAFSGAAERTQAIADAEKNLADARRDAAAADMSESAKRSADERVLLAEQELALAKAQGEKLGTTFMDALRAQAERAHEFASKIRQLIAAGIDKDSPLMQMVLAEGAEGGSAIIDELLAGGVTTLNEATDLVDAVQKEANDVGLESAEYFKGAGVRSAWNVVKGFDDQFGKDGKGREKIMRIMDNLAKKMARTAVIDIEITKNVNEVITRVVQEIRAPMGAVEGAGATGAIVRRPTFALIGEAGPEALIPLNRTRGNAPISDLRGGGIVINVNAGIGTDGAEVGREIVDAIRKYERRSGPVFASA